MILYDIPDIRLFWSQDRRFLEQFQADTVSQFQPFSKYPGAYRDVSFWLPPSWHDHDLFELVRSIASDLVESVQQVRPHARPTIL